MKKRIIVYGVNYFPAKGGTSTVVENLILQLKEKYDITIYCYKHPDAQDHIAGVKVVELKQLVKGSIGSMLYFLASSFHILFFGRADFIHAHKTDCAIFIPLLRLRFKVVATSHEAPYKRDKWNLIEKTYFHVAESIFIRSASLCTCISQPLSVYYEEKYKRKVFFIPNGINKTSEQDFDYKKAETFLPPGCSLDNPFILFSARRLMSTKGAHTMLQALRQLQYSGQVFIAGELEGTPYLDKLKKLAEGLNVHFLGYVEPLNALLALVARASLFIFPSETEGMSIMLLEVASVGTGIIASDINENLQVFSTNQVLYFKCSDPGDLANKITFALNDPLKMKDLGLNAKTLVNTEYLWEKIAVNYDNIYKIS